MASSESEAVGRVTREGQTLAASDQRIAEEAIALLERSQDPRLRGSLGSLRGAAYPGDFSHDEDAREPVGKRAQDLESVTKAEWDAAAAGELSTADRMRTSDVVRKSQEAYLAEMGSGHARMVAQERDRERVARASRGGR